MEKKTKEIKGIIIVY